MVVTAMRILVVGVLPRGAVDILRRFNDRGWGSRQVLTLQQGREQLETYDFDVVLATETLCDGRGYDVAEIVTRHRERFSSAWRFPIAACGCRSSSAASACWASAL